MRPYHRPVRIWLGVVLSFAMGACAYHGDFNNPIQRRVQWFSLLDGGDIRAACTAGSLDRYRLVYNARFSEQVRIYEITADGAGGAYLLARARGASTNLLNFRLSDPLGMFRWDESQTRLTPEEFTAFKSRLNLDGFGAPPVGDRFSSTQFYWVASGCQDGVHKFGAWRYPSERFLAMTVPAFLFAKDQTGRPINNPRGVGGGDFAGPPGRTAEGGSDAPFLITIEADGLGGTPR